MDFLVDSNVLIDISTIDPVWYTWSSVTLERALETGRLIVNPLIYAEVSVRFSTLEKLDAFFSFGRFTKEPLPWDAAFLAGKAFVKYRRAGGLRTAPLPDFYIGAHAAVTGRTLITRDGGRYREYFPGLDIIAP